jgi:hypothetical protein
MPEVKVDLSERNLARIRNGHTIQLKASQIGGGTKIQVNDELAKRVATAMKKNKGVKIQLSAQEIEASGLKLRDVGRALQKMGKAYNRKVKPVVGPIIRDVMTQVVKKGLPAAAIAMGQPELAAPAALLADKYAASAVNALGDATGGFGVKAKARKTTRAKGPSKPPAVPKRAITYDENMSGFLPANHPAMWPSNSVQSDHSIRVTKGGSFRMAS